MKVAIYVRVSTEEQAREGYSIAAQKKKLEDFASSQDWKVYDFYIDDGYSAKNLERPQMQRMIKDVEKRKFDVVLSYRLDRLVRSVSDLYKLLQMFDQYQVKYKSATEMFDTTSAMGRFFITLVGAMAQWERENLGERVHMGMKRMVEEQKRPGGMAPFGYDLKDGQLFINEEEAEWVRYIFNAFLTKGKRAIAETLNNAGIKTRRGNYWNDGVVAFLANNPVYCGAIRWNYRKVSGEKTNEEITVEGTHEAIISKELFDQVQEVMHSRKGKGFKGTSDYPFSGVLRCARCGKSMVGGSTTRHGTHKRFYRCVGRHQFKICDLPNVPEASIEKTFFEELEAPMQPIEIETDDTDYPKIEKELIKIEKKAERIKELYLEGDITKDEYNYRMSKEQKKKLKLESQLKNKKEVIDLDQVREAIEDLKEFWSQLPYSKRKEAVHAIIDKLFIDVTYTARHRGEKTIVAITDYTLK